MQVINRLRLRKFWSDHQRAETELRAWFQLMTSHDWESPDALSATFPAARFYADLVAFDLHGSSYFVIVSIDYQCSTLWIRDVLVHSEFGTDEWQHLAASDTSSSRTYADLVSELPLRPIRDDDQLRQAIARTEALLARADRSLDEQDYLEVLSLLIEHYERQHVEIPPVSAAEIVRKLISEHRLTQKEIIPLLGGKDKAMALLRGDRPLDLRQATRAARYFKLPVETFVDPDDLEIEIPTAPRRRR